MPVRTYVPGLRFVLNAAYKFGTRYQTQLSGSLTAPQLACLTSTLEAILACLVLLGQATEGD
jgi:hypothetical protein